MCVGSWLNHVFLLFLLCMFSQTNCCNPGDPECGEKTGDELCSLDSLNKDKNGVELLVTGLVTHGDCATPVANEPLTLWQVNHQGGLSSSDFCQGSVTTDEKGAYKFKTVVPDKTSQQAAVITLCLPHALGPNENPCNNVYVELNNNIDLSNPLAHSLDIVRPDEETINGQVRYRTKLKWCAGKQKRVKRDIEDEEDKRSWAGNDMTWLKRSWSNANAEWLKRNVEPRWYNWVDSGSKRWNNAPIGWLRKRSYNPYEDEVEKRGRDEWGDADAEWLKKRAWYNANTEWLKRSPWSANDMGGWLKRAWSNADTQWLKKRGWGNDLPSQKRWKNDAAMDWLRKRGWEGADINWIKRGGMVPDDDSDVEKRSWSNANTEWIKRDSDMHHVHHVAKRDTSQIQEDTVVGQPSASEHSSERMKKSVGNVMEEADTVERQHELSKKGWNDASFNWLKRDPEDEKDKKSWGQAGMGWIKKKKVPTATLR